MGYSVQAVVDLPHPGPQQQLEDEGDPQLPQQHVVVAPLQVGRLIYKHLTRFCCCCAYDFCVETVCFMCLRN